MTVSSTRDLLGIAIIRNLKRASLLYLVSWICLDGSYKHDYVVCPYFVAWTIFSKIWMSYLTVDFYFNVNLLLIRC